MQPMYVLNILIVTIYGLIEVCPSPCLHFLLLVTQWLHCSHVAIILARAPQAFITQHLPELLHAPADDKSNDGRVVVYKHPILPYRALSQLLEFWYTGEIQSVEGYEQQEATSPIQSTLSLSSTTSSASSMTVSTDNNDEILRGIREEEQLLGTPLLMMPSCDNSLAAAVNSLDQLVADIIRMYKHQLAADVTILLYAGVSSSFNNTSSRSSTISACATTSFAVHRCILAAQSGYFHAMFCKEFCEASSPVVYLPSDVFTPDAFQVILDYYYTGCIQLATRNDNDDEEEDDTPSLQPTHEGHRLTQKILMMRVFQDAFRVAEYLGQYETVCKALMQAMADIVKQYKCTCRDCAALLPSMLWFADRNVPDLRAHIISLYTDPTYALATLWPATTFGVLIESKPALATELVERMKSTNIKKQTAIQVLEALHLCLARVRNPTVREIVDKQLVSYTVQMISDNFEFYCVEYPILLSCVDGIAVGSVDFLEFLLMQVVQHGINERNAGGLYQGIVGDLIGRHQEMDVDSVVDNVLMDARQQCIDYIAKHWSSIKSQGGFRGVDKEMMRRLSEDLDVSYRTLTKHTLDAEIASLFSFKSRKRSFGDLRGRRNSVCSNASNGSSGGYHSRRRLSLLSLRSRRSHESLAPVHRTISTPSPSKFPNLIPSRSLPTKSSSASVSRTTTITSNANHTSHQADKSPDMSQCSISSAALIDALLPIESASPSSANSRRSMSSNSIKNGSSQPTTNNNTAGRPTRLRFELPKIPQRPIVAPNRLVLQKKSEKKKKKRSRSPLRYYRFGFGYDSSDEDEDLPQVPVLGARVRLLRRPLPMTGTIKFIGPVHFARGIYVGIELESRCKCLHVRSQKHCLT